MHGEPVQNVHADTAAQTGNAGAVHRVIRRAVLHADAAYSIRNACADADCTLLRRNLHAGFLRIVHEVAEGAYQINIGNACFRRECDMRFHGDPFLLRLADAAEQERIHNGVFTFAQVGLEFMPRNKLISIPGGLFQLAVFQQRANCVHVACDIMAEHADGFILCGQRAVVLLLTFHLLRKVCVDCLKPTLDINYAPGAGLQSNVVNTKLDIPVNVTVKIGGTDVNEYTTFLHTACDPACGFDANKEEFLLHVKTCTLTITKTGGAENEPYVFTVNKDGEKYTEASITGNGNVTIYELPVGTYTIAEDTGWSWRYNAGNGGSAELTANNPTGSITCANTKVNNFWLNGFSSVVQNIFGVSSTMNAN